MVGVVALRCFISIVETQKRVITVLLELTRSRRSLDTISLHLSFFFSNPSVRPLILAGRLSLFRVLSVAWIPLYMMPLRNTISVLRDEVSLVLDPLPCQRRARR